MQKDTPAASHLLKRIQCQTSENIPPRVTLSWQPLIDEPLRARAIKAALCVAERLRTPEQVNEIVRVAYQQSSIPIIWKGCTFPSGFAGTALMYNFITQCFPEEKWDTATLCHLRSAVADTQQHPFKKPGLYGGTSGMGLTLQMLSRRDKRYQKSMNALHQSLYEQVQKYAWPRSEKDVAVGDYDIVSGASGILAYLLTVEQPNDQILNTIELLLDYLIWLAEPDQEHWYISPDHLTSDDKHLYLQGYFNCGLAHGIPGPLAVLALTWLRGYRYPGLQESITHLSTWMMKHQVIDEWGINWPNVVPLQQFQSINDRQPLPGARAAWCYGAPGVARSLWLAGQALEDASLCQVAIDAIEAVLRRPIPVRRIDSSTLCHGVAGLLQICLRFAHESESSIIRQHIPLLVNQLLEAFNPDYALGFRDLERDHVYVDQPGWLYGASGIAMVLLAASTSVNPEWDRALVIS